MACCKYFTKGGYKRKDCDIGYALAVSSCEGTLSVEHAPPQPFDVITAFAVPNPGYPSQSSRIFRVWVFRELPRRTLTQSTSDWLILFEPTLSTVDGSHTKQLSNNCQRRFSVQTHMWKTSDGMRCECRNHCRLEL